MPVKRHERSEQALALRESDPDAWNALHPSVKDEALLYFDVRSSEQRNAERLR